MLYLSNAPLIYYFWNFEYVYIKSSNQINLI